MSNDNLEIFRQMSFVSSVLAGFAIAVAIELIALAKKGPLAFAAITAFLTSSIISVAATFSFVIVMTSMIGPEGSTQPSDEWIIRFIGGIGVLPLTGFFLFIVGIGLVGWLHSKPLGIITSVCAVLALVLVIYILRSLTSL